MRILKGYFVAALLASAVTCVTSISVSAGEKCRQTTVATTCNPADTSSVSQPAEATSQTCCQPAAASIQPKIELVAYARPATPRRLAPQPDALDINNTSADTACAMYMAADYGTYQLYYGIRCSNRSSIQIYGNGLGPLPGNCTNPNGACVTLGSSVIPTAFNETSSSTSESVFMKSVRLAQKRKAGQGPSNPADPLATGPHKLRERTRVGQPIYIKMEQPDGASGAVLVELQRYFVRGTGKSSEELSGTFALGTEIDSVPNGKITKVISPEQIQVMADNAARVKIGNVTYDIVTATKLTP